MKPLPRINADTRIFWEGARARELRYQRCATCGNVQFPPAKLCSACLSEDLAWHVSAGLGSVYSFTTVHRAPTAEFRSDAPYVLALVDLREGFRMMFNIRESDPGAVAIGSEVEIIFEATERDDILLPQARLSRREAVAA